MNPKDYGVLTFDQEKQFLKTVCFFCVPDARRLILQSPSFYLLCGLGPVTAGYVILAPRDHIVSFAALPGGLDEEAATLAQLVIELQHRLFSEPVIFEHGKMGCVFDESRDYRHCFHAHLNFMPLREADFAVADEPFVAWAPTGCSYPWEEAVDPEGHYLWIRYRNIASVSKWVSRLATPSQYLRRILGRAAGQANWDWQMNPNYAQVLAEAVACRRELKQMKLPESFVVYNL